MKKIIGILLSAVIAVSSATISMAAITFSDINNVPWEGAKNYIVKVAELGLMVGQENGNGTSLFRAKDKVTYCETVQLAYTILKNSGKIETSQATTSKWKSVMSGYKVPEWAYEAISYALENKIISVTDLAGFMTTKGVNNNATREDVAVIFGRALCSANYDTNEEPYLEFEDKSEIARSSFPYVELLSECKILVGDDDGNFNPKKLINRAEMAVVVTKTYAEVSGTEINLNSSGAIGTIISVVDNNGVRTITMKLSDGTKLVLSGDKSTPTTYKDSPTNFLQLTAGDNITVNYVEGTITDVVVNFDFINDTSDVVIGTINYMTSEKITVNLDDGGTAIFPLATNASISMNNKVSAINKITKVIDNGVEVDVVLKVSNGTVTEVSAAGDEDTVQGTITKISSKEVTIKRTGGSEKTYSYTDYVTVKYDGETSRISKIEDIIDDSSELFVTATLDDGDIEKMVVTVSKLGGSVKGFLKKVTDDKIVVAISDTESKTYYINEEPIVTYEGDEISYSKLVDKFEDGTALTATVYLNSSKKISKIEAVLEDNDTGFITNLTDTYITIFTSAGISRKCLLEKDVVIKFYGGSTESLSYLQSIYETGKTEVTLTFNKKDEVVKVLVDLDQEKYGRISGEIFEMDSDSMKIGEKMVYLSDSTVVKIDDKESTWELLSKGVQSEETYDATAIFNDDIAKDVNAELIGASGKLNEIKFGEITLNTKTGIRTYKLARDEDLKIRIDDEKTSYSFKDFYSLWYESKNNYSVILTIDKGVVVRINATTL